MAPVDTMSIPMVDDAGASKRVPIHFPSGLAIADFQAFWDAAALELDVITGAVIGQPSVTITLTNPVGMKSSTLLDQFNRQGALLSFGAANTNFSWSQYIPAFRDSLISGGDPVVTDGAFVAWRDRMLTGEAGPPARLPSDRYANDLDTFIGAVLSFRK